MRVSTRWVRRSTSAAASSWSCNSHVPPPYHLTLSCCPSPLRGHPPVGAVPSSVVRQNDVVLFTSFAFPTTASIFQRKDMGIARTTQQSLRFTTGTTYHMKVPHMGDSISDGTISSWKKQVGDMVVEDEVICVIETDKVSVDIHASMAGRVTAHAAEEGGIVLVGGDLVSLDTTAIITSASPCLEASPSAASPSPSSTAAVSVGNHTGRKYTPMIAFPNRRLASLNSTHKKSNSPNQSMQGVKTSNSSKDQSQGFERYEDFSDLPARYKSRPMTEEEIGVINSGGVAWKGGHPAGHWRTIVEEVQ